MVEVELGGERAWFSKGGWRGDPLLVRRLGRATCLLLDLERVDCGPDTPDVEQAIAQAVAEYLGGRVMPVTRPEPSAA